MKITREKIQTRIAELEFAFSKTQSKIDELGGAIQECKLFLEYLIKVEPLKETEDKSKIGETVS
jgi:uncharacterized coiled-coil protein SlyX